MRGILTFAAFAQAIDNGLWLLGVVPHFELYEGRARWSCAPYVVDLHAIDRVRAKIILSADGALCHASAPGRMTQAGAQALALAVGMLFGGRSVAQGETASVSHGKERSKRATDGRSKTDSGSRDVERSPH